MKYIIILFMFAVSIYSQECNCGNWDAKVISIERIDTVYVITGINLMPDCKTETGIYFEWFTDGYGRTELSEGMIINFDKWRPFWGYWKYSKVYAGGKKNGK